MNRQFSENLQTELRRQGFTEVKEWHRAILQSTQFRGENGRSITLNAVGIGINDRVAIALVETFIKLTDARPGQDVWSLSLANNKLTDKSAPYLEVLLMRCGCLVKLDISNNNLTPDGLRRLNEALDKLPVKPAVLVDGNTGPGSLNNSTGPGSRASAASSGRRPTSDASNGSGSNVDIAALRRRRDQMLRQEGLQDSEGARRERDSLSKELGLDADFGPPELSEGMSSQSTNPQTSHRMVTQNPGASPAGATPQRGARVSAPPAQAGRSPSANAQQPSRTPPPTAAPAAQSPSSSARPPRQTSPVAISTTSDSPSGLENTATFGRTRNRRRRRRGDVKQDHNFDSTDDDEEEGDNGETTPPPAANHRSPGHTSVGLGSNRNSSVIRAGSSGSHGTQDTELPDRQDLLDVTAAVSEYDVVGNWGACGVQPDELVSAHRFAGLTVINLSHNGIEHLEPHVFPPTLARLDLSNNFLTEITGVERATMMCVLNVRRNRLTKFSGLEANVALAHLFAGRNRLKGVTGIAHLAALEVLDISFNDVRFESALRPLSMHGGLKHLICHDNPVFTTQRKTRPLPGSATTAAKHPNPRAMLRNLVPSLLALDNDRLTYSRIAESLSATADLAPNGPGASSIMISPGTAPPWSSTLNATGTSRFADPTELSGFLPANQMRGGAIPAGYSAPGRVEEKIKKIQGQATKQRTAAKSQVQRDRSAVSRKDILAGIAAKNKAQLENTIAERLTLQAQAAQDPMKGDTSDGPEPEEDDYHYEVTGPNSAEYQAAAARQQSRARSAQRSQTLDEDGWEQQRAEKALSSSPIMHQSGNSAGSPRSSMAAEAFMRNVSVHHQRNFSEDSDMFQEADRLSDDVNSRQNTIDLRHMNSAVTVQGDGMDLPAGDDEDPGSVPAVRGGGSPPAGGGVYPLLGGSKRPVAPRRSSSPASGQQQQQQHQTPEPRQQAQNRRPIPAPQPGSPPQYPSDGMSTPYPPARLAAAEKTPYYSPIPRDEDPNATRMSNATGIVSPPPRGDDSSAYISRRIPPPPASQHHNYGEGPSLAEAEDDVEVAEWLHQLHQDATAVRIAFRTLLIVLDSKEGGNAAERDRCLRIIRTSGMMEDTTIPAAVVEAFDFTEAELNTPPSGTHLLDVSGSSAVSAAADSHGRRAAILRSVHRLGETKTCMRYITALMENNRNDLLKRYMVRIKDVIPRLVENAAEPPIVPSRTAA